MHKFQFWAKGGDVVDIRKVLEEYDGMFAVKTPDEIGAFLSEHIAEAEMEGDKASLLTLLNEQIGFARDRGRRDEALSGCDKLRTLIDEMGLAGTIHYGKSLLNIANAKRAFGMFAEAEDLFAEIERLYVTILPEGSYDYAPLYNNWSLLALDTGDTERACDLVRLSLDVVDRYKGAVINQATTRVNLACMLMNNENRLSEAEMLVDEAIRLFESQGGDDYHFAAALSARGDILMKKQAYSEAADYYSRAAGIVRMYLGDNPKTRALEEKYKHACSMME